MCVVCSAVLHWYTAVEARVHDNINNRADWVIFIAILSIQIMTLFDPSKLNINNRADWLIFIAILRYKSVTLFDPSKLC